MTDHSFKRDRPGSSPKSSPKSSIDLREKQREFYEEYFRKGVELTQALLAENDELRARLAELEEKVNRDGSSGHDTERIERDHHDLACLFVTQTQLGQTSEVREATTVITEVLLNFVGANRFAIYITNGASHPKPLYVYNAERSALGDPGELVIAAAHTGQTSLGAVEQRDVGDDPVAVFPLRTAAGPFGAVAIWSFLPQKQELAAIDRRLFDVLGWAGGSALEMARLRGQPQSTDPPDRFSALSLLLGLG